MPSSISRREFLQRGGQAALFLTQAFPVDRLTKVLSAQIPEWMRMARLPGLSMAVIRQSRVAWRGSFGVVDASGLQPVTDATMFEAASISKPVFAYVVMKLCEEGRLGLDTPLTNYTSERFLEGDARLDLITARHVLAHTTGFQNWRSDTSPLAIQFTPGTKHQYSGEGYNYLQTVVTGLLKEPFERYMRTRLFDPLRMMSSQYVWDDRVSRRMARPHDSDGKPLANTKSTPEGVARYGSAGALLTTPSDLARLIVAVIDPPPADAFYMKPDTVREMLRPQVKIEAGLYPASWALGWQIFHNANRDFIFHGGDNKGFHCAAVASVAGKSGYVAMTNGESGPEVLRNLLTADVMQEFLAA